jgi:hypothetical protein
MTSTNQSSGRWGWCKGVMSDGDSDESDEGTDEGAGEERPAEHDLELATRSAI